MPSVAAILRELRFRPRSTAELMRDLLRVELPPFDGVRVEALDGTAARDDAPIVVVLLDGRRPVFAIVTDALDACDSPSRVMWPRWRRAVGARVSAPTAVLIVTADPVVERWAKQPVFLPAPEPPFEAYVLGPSAVPEDAKDTPILLLMALAAKITTEA